MVDGTIIEESKSDRTDLYFVGILILLSIITFCLHPFARGLWVLDEVRYGEAVRSMISTGKFFTPHLNGEIYSDKPPLFFWYLMVFAKISGSIAPPVLFIATSISGIACVIATYFLGKTAFDRETAFIASLVMLTSMLFIGIAQFIRMDLIMLLFMLLALHAFCKGYTTNQRWRYYLVYIFLSLSILTKGPLGFFIVLASIITYLIHKKDSREVLRLKLPQGIAIVGLIIGLWLLLTVWESGTGYIQSVWHKQLLGRAIKAWIHEQKVYYYLIWLPVTFLPWTAHVPRAFVRMWKDKTGFGKLLVWWFLCGLIILSAISYKIFIYILLFLPALALMTGVVLRPLIFNNKKRSLLAECKATACLLLLMAAGAFFTWTISKRELSLSLSNSFPFLEHGYLKNAAALMPIGALTGIAAFAVLTFGIARNHRRVVVTLTVLMVLISNLLMSIIARSLDDEMSPRIFCQEIKKRNEAGFAPAEYWVEFGILNYYANTDTVRLHTLEEMEKFLYENPRAVIAITENHWELNKHRIHTVELTNRSYITGRSSQRTYYLLIQDGEKLRPLVNAMLNYQNKGYTLARYRNGGNLFDHYLNDDVEMLSSPEELNAFLKKHPSAAILTSAYRFRQDGRYLKSLKRKKRVKLGVKTYLILLHNPDSH